MGDGAEQHPLDSNRLRCRQRDSVKGTTQQLPHLQITFHLQMPESVLWPLQDRELRVNRFYALVSRGVMAFPWSRWIVLCTTASSISLTGRGTAGSNPERRVCSKGIRARLREAIVQGSAAAGLHFQPGGTSGREQEGGTRLWLFALAHGTDRRGGIASTRSALAMSCSKSCSLDCSWRCSAVSSVLSSRSSSAMVVNACCSSDNDSD